MRRLNIATRGPLNWRERLGDPELHWKRGASAMETSVAWECATRTPSGLPEPIRRLLSESELGASELLMAIAEHKVPLRGTGGGSQCDVWALVKTMVGTVSLAVEAKAAEPFGAGNEPLETWMKSGTSPNSEANRVKRWSHIRENLPEAHREAYGVVPFQILQRCASAVIEARRFGLTTAAFVVQSFGSPSSSFDQFAAFCAALGISAEQGRMGFVTMSEVRLGVGWAECPFATDKEMASLI